MQSTRQAYLPFILLAVAILALYSLFPTQTHYWDGVLFSFNIEAVHHGELPQGVLFHPNHLLYSALGYLAYKVFLACGLALRAITVLQILNTIFAALGACVLFAFARRITGSISIAAFCAVLFAFGATWWKFSTDADAYVIAVLLLLLTLDCVTRERPRFLPAALCQTGAMLFHELAVFAYVPVLVAIALDTRRSKANRVWTSVVYVAATAAYVAMVYALAYQTADHSAYPTMMAWVLSRSAASQTTHALKQFPVQYAMSYVKLFAGGKASMIRDFFSAAEALAFAICALCIGGAAYLFRRPSPQIATAPKKNVLLILWAALLPYAIFFAWWEPASAFYKLFLWAPLVLLLGSYIAGSTWTAQRAHALLALAAGLAAWNFGAYIYPHSRTRADPVLELALRINRELPQSATIYYDSFSPDDWYLAYFASGRRWLKLPAGDVAALTKKHGALVCFDTTALGALESSGTRPPIDPAMRWDLTTRQHYVRLECLK